MVEEIEELGTEFEAKPIIGTELRVLERREVDVFDSVRAQIGLGARIGSVPIVVCKCECRGIKPLIQPLV